MLQWLLYKQEVRPLIRAKASCCNDTTHTYTCSYSLWLHIYSNTHTHTHNHTSLLLTQAYMHTYQMGDGCDGGVSLKRDRSSLTRTGTCKRRTEKREGKRALEMAFMVLDYLSFSELTRVRETSRFKKLELVQRL